MPFDDRREAGRRLAERLIRFRSEHPIVVGLARGGVPVAAEVARALDAPLDVLVVRKLGCPWQPELGIGAIGEGDVRVINAPLAELLGIGEGSLDEVAAREGAELDRRVRRYRGERPLVPVEGRTVILVDDGLATGFTARAGIEVLRHRGARRVIVAAPVAPREAVEELRAAADDVVVVETPAELLAIGAWYVNFAQTSDEEITELLAGSTASVETEAKRDALSDVVLTIGSIRLPGTLAVPERAFGVVLFAHGSGSSRLSPRNLAVAEALNRGGAATLLFDLLTPDEELDRAKVFDIELLAARLVGATRWLRGREDVGELPIGYFGASTGAAAALCAAADLPHEIRAVVSRGGRPDLAAPWLTAVKAPTLLVVGGRDQAVLELNRQARQLLRCPSRLAVVPGASHLFEEPGALERVAALALYWLARYLPAAALAPI